MLALTVIPGFKGDDPASPHLIQRLITAELGRNLLLLPMRDHKGLQGRLLRLSAATVSWREPGNVPTIERRPAWQWSAWSRDELR